MAHFVKIENGHVTQVIVVSNDDAPGTLPDSETAGQAFLAGLGIEGEWVQTSYSGSMRGKYAGIGDLWDGTNFTPPITEAL